MLSACESNLNGQQTEGLLTPIGIGPSLAAAGVKTVVGTLWSCNGLAALCFNYYFYKIAQKNPQMPWHIVAAKARKALKQMRQEDLENIATEFNLDDKNLCHELLDQLASTALFIPPFEDFSYWACFSVLGNVQRQQN
jgi:CHAT domain-containing protein